MFLSIIIPVHNQEKYICDCLDSCIDQDIPKSEYEIICIDDCSTDESLRILYEYQRKESNIFIIRFSKNRGVGEARNAGLNAMHGDYCLFLDGDDYLADNCLSKIKERIEKETNNTMLFFGRYKFNDKMCTDRHDNLKNGKYLGCPTERYITNRIIPAALLSHLRFQKNINYGEDEVLSIELKALNPKAITIDEPLYFYRIHSQSAMQSLKVNIRKNLKRINSLINTVVYIRKKYGLSQKLFLDFFNEQKELALDEIYRLPLYLTIYYLIKLRMLKIITFKESDSQKPISFKTIVQRIKSIMQRIIKKE